MPGFLESLSTLVQCWWMLTVVCLRWRRESRRSHPTNWRPTYLCSRLRDRCQSVFQVRVALLLAIGWRGLGGYSSSVDFVRYRGFITPGLT